MRARLSVAAASALVLSSAPVLADFDEPPKRNGVGLSLTAALVPAFVATVEHLVGAETTVWATAGAGSTRSTRFAGEEVRRVLVVGGAGARHYLNEFFFLHADLTYVHISGERDEVVRTASSWSNREERLAALYLPGLSAGAGIGASGALGSFFGELSLVARWVFLAGRPTRAQQNNTNDAGTVGVIPSVVVGYRWL